MTGQDGAYLARLLAGKNYDVHGTSRDAEVARTQGLVLLGIRDSVTMHSMSPVDFRSVVQTIERVQPDEIYNLSGQSSVALSFVQPAETMESIVLDTLNILEALRPDVGRVRFYNAGSSEGFGDIGHAPADESTAFRPKSPYGVAKAAAVSRPVRAAPSKTLSPRLSPPPVSTGRRMSISPRRLHVRATSRVRWAMLPRQSACSAGRRRCALWTSSNA